MIEKRRGSGKVTIMNTESTEPLRCVELDCAAIGLRSEDDAVAGAKGFCCRVIMVVAGGPLMAATG